MAVELHLYVVSVEVDAQGRSPPHYRQATATCALWAVTSEDAIAAAKADLQRSGYQNLPGDEHAERLDPAQWEAFLRQHWPAQVSIALLPDRPCAGAPRAATALGFYPHE